MNIVTKDRFLGPYDLTSDAAAARWLGLWVRILPTVWESVFCECCVLSGRDLCDRLANVQRGPTQCGASNWVWSWNLDKEEALALPRVRWSPFSYFCLSLGHNWLPQSMCFPLCDRHSFTPIHNSRRQYSSLHFILHGLRQQIVLQTGRSRDRFPMVSWEFFINIILSAPLWPWGRLGV
jgi:hypothetical protein